MIESKGVEAYDTFMRNFKIGAGRFPHIKNFKRCRDRSLFPVLRPGFNMSKETSVFTIGSCFARNIEKVLVSKGLSVTTSNFKVKAGEIPYEDAQILNEYNMQTMLQRVLSANGEFRYQPEMGIEKVDGGFVDLFLHRNSAPVTMERLVERRLEIDELYKCLLQSDLVILTLGLVESWFDSKHNVYLNRMPSVETMKSESNRYVFRRLDYDEVTSALNKIAATLLNNGVKNIMITVSPVPIEATFMEDDVVIANSYSKSVLRVAADIVSKSDHRIDYFPSYEIVTSKGTGNFKEDNVHVLDGIVAQVTEYMTEYYLK